MTLYTWRTGADEHPEDSVLQFFTDVITTFGVKDLGGDDHFLVSEKGAGADMSVDVAAGRALVGKSGANCYPVRNTATVNKSVSSNSSGNPRIDTVVLFDNLGATPNADGSGVAELAVVAGTPAASPTAPDDAAIATAIGSSSYPFIRLANIAVANGASSIVDANITDVRTQASLSDGVVKSGAKAYADKYKSGSIMIVDALTDLETGDGKGIIRIPSYLNGAIIKRVSASVTTAPTGAAISIQIRNVTQGYDILSTPLTIDATETDSNTAATPAVIDNTKDDVATSDVIRFDIDQVGSSVVGKGLVVGIEFEAA